MKYIHEAFDSNWIAPTGPNVDKFEHELEKFTGSKYASALSSGTAAIHLALIILEVKQGDFVLCSSFTFSASVNPVVYCNAMPILIDCEESSWNMDPVLLEKALEDCMNKGNKPKAVIVTHLYGMPAKIDKIIEIAREYDVPVIEDAAEALGATYKGQHVGTLGDIGILSFNGNKIITTSGGGAMISNNKDYIKRAKFLSTQARDDAPHYQHSEIGYNYRMSNIVAGIGRGQLEVLSERVNTRREINKFYRKYLSDIPGLTFQTEHNDQLSNFWLTTILLDPEITNGKTREDLRLTLEKENIETRPLWKPMHLQPVFKEFPWFKEQRLEISERLYEQGFYLPSGLTLTEKELEYVASAIKEEIQ